MNRRDLVVLALVALLLHGGVLASVLGNPERQIEEDSRGYLVLASNLSADGRFGRPVRTGPSADETWRPEMARTPGYPAVISVFDRITGSGRAATIVLQHALTIALCLVAAVLCGSLWGRRAGLAAGWLLALDLQGLALGSMILTETLYGVALFGCVWLTASLIDRPGLVRAAGAGALAGATALLRPTSIVFPIALALAIAVWYVARRQSRLVSAAAIVAITGMAVVGAWTVRNGRVAGQYTLSTVARYNMLACHAAGALARSEDLEDQEAINRLCAKAGITEQQLRYLPLTREEESRARDVAMGTIRENVSGFARDYILRTANMATGPEKHILTVLGIPWISFSGQREPGPTGMTLLAALSLLAFQFVFMVVVYLLVLRSLFRTLRDRRMSPLLWASVVAAAYVLVLSSGSPGDPRMRWPALPLLIVVAASGFTDRRSVRLQADRQGEDVGARAKLS